MVAGIELRRAGGFAHTLVLRHAHTTPSHTPDVLPA